jgi:hypothetical protein
MAKDQKAPKPPSNKSAIGFKPMSQIQLTVTGAEGAASLPSGVKGYGRALFGSAPAKPFINEVIIAIAENNAATIEVVVVRTKPENVHQVDELKRGTFSIDELHPTNAQKTGETVAVLLKQRGASGQCSRALNDFVRGNDPKTQGNPKGHSITFKLDNNRVTTTTT